MNRDDGATSDEVAALYHAVRPRYPAELFHQILTLPGIGPGARVLEIGMGTGIVTAELLEAGFGVTGIEPDAALVKVARRHLRHHSHLQVIESRFEDWENPGQPFDLVFAATAFHWFDRRTRVARAATCLRKGGYLAIASYRHVAGGDDVFFETMQRCYGAHMPGAKSDKRLHSSAEIRPATREVTRQRLFEKPEVFRWEVAEHYDRASYLDLLSTYSGHRLLDEAHREALFRCIGEQIDRVPGGRICKNYLHEVIVARKT